MSGVADRSSIEIDARRENLAGVRDFVEQQALQYGLALDDARALRLAVDEAVANVILHGYQGRAGTIEVIVEHDPAAVVVRVRDQAPGFNPLSTPPPDLTRPLEDRPPGGAGVLLMRESVDALEYRAPPEGGNELVFRKLHPPRAKQSGA